MKRLLTIAGATGAAGLALALAAAPALAATADTPPYEPSINSLGTISFFDASGNRVTGGSTTAAFPRYEVASNTVKTGDNGAQVRLCLPVNGQDPRNYSCDSFNAFTAYPVVGAGVPASISGARTTDTPPAPAPVSTVTAADLTLDDLTSEFPNKATDGYANLYQIRLYTTSSVTNVNSDQYAAADVKVDPATKTFTVVYPTQPTTPPALPEAPLAVGLPLAGVAVAGGALALRRRRSVATD